jgi:hypothetical protein
MKTIDIKDVKQIVFWNPRVDKSSTLDSANVVLIQEDEVFVVIEFPNREALDRFRAQLADI